LLIIFFFRFFLFVYSFQLETINTRDENLQKADKKPKLNIIKKDLTINLQTRSV
jgi:hypothetical protein